jgi:RNA polymerase sigma factor (sigma-70 family)
VAAQRTAPDPQAPPDGLQQACELYRQELRRFFKAHARNPDVVDDLVQVVYLRLLSSRPTEPILDPRQYMYRVAWNELHRENGRWGREQQRAVTCEPKELVQLSEYIDALWIDNSTEELESEQVNRALRQLPVVCQVAFLRKNRDGWSYKEIAEELKVTPHAVKKYIVKALAHFRAHFITSDVEPE